MDLDKKELLDKINRYLINQTAFLKVKDTLNDYQLTTFVDQAIRDMCYEQNIQMTLEQRSLIVRNLVSSIVSLGPLRSVLEDQSITEVMINGYNQVYIQRDGKIILTDIIFNDTKHLQHTIQKILATSGTNKRVDESSPYVDFSLPDGSRVNVILPPCSMIGPVMTIRKFKKDITFVEDLIKLGMIDQNIATLLVNAVKAKLNIVFCGATGSGKTTTLNVFSRYIPEHERIITIEDTPELRLHQKHVVSLASKPANIEGKGIITIRDLFVNSLRMRPDRVIIGEVRGEEMLDMIQSISSGHSGSLAIVHAETPQDCFNRMVTLMLMTGIRLSTMEIQKQIAHAIDLIVHVELYMDGKRRVAYVSDLYHQDMPGRVVLKNLFAFEEKHMDEYGNIHGEWVMSQSKPSCFQKFVKRRVEFPKEFLDHWSS